MGHWTADDIPWQDFDAQRVDPDILAVIKAASLVERNAADYTTYLCNVFADDDAFQATAREWQVEEVQHGDVLGRWAELADPTFSFAASFDRFVAGYRIPMDRSESVRGSRTGELVARCIVETGTSSFYSALRDATAEPVLKTICHRIAGDEFRHYKTFYTWTGRYAARERVGRMHRLRVALGRLREMDDDELAFAYHCGNAAGQPYDRASANAAYVRRAFGCYHPGHLARGTNMILKAVGLPAQGWLGRVARTAAWRLMQRRLTASA